MEGVVEARDARIEKRVSISSSPEWAGGKEGKDGVSFIIKKARGKGEFQGLEVERRYEERPGIAA